MYHSFFKYYLISLILLAFGLPSQLRSQTNIEGVVLDELHSPIFGATVRELGGTEGTLSQSNGRFKLSLKPRAKVVIEISYLGYRTIVDTLLAGSNKTLKYILKPALNQLQEVVVQDHYEAQRQRAEAVHVDVLSTDYLQQNRANNLIQSIDQIPGIQSMDIGGGQSKPMIRGLGFDRVAVVENGIKHESQQWGADHGLEIDQMGIDRIELIKGPQALLYGSDAIGGVIVLQQTQVPKAHTTKSSLDLWSNSNNGLWGVSGGLGYRAERWFTIARIGYSDFADLRVPSDSVDVYSYKVPLNQGKVRNTAGREINAHLVLGYLGEKITHKLHASVLDHQAGFFANAFGLEPRNVDTELHDRSNRDIQWPYQTVQHYKVNTLSKWNAGHYQMELEQGLQANFREERSPYVQHGYMPAEVPENMKSIADLEKAFEKWTYSAIAKYHRQWNENVKTTTGLSYTFQDNQIDGIGFIIPAYRQHQAAAFAWFNQALSQNLSWQMGARLDYTHLKSDAYADWFTSPIVNGSDTQMVFLTRSTASQNQWFSWSGAVGLIWNKAHVLTKLNLGKSFRMPTAKELHTNGVNYHHFSFEKGHPNLNPESSYQLDATIEYHKKNWSVGLTPYVNYFDNFIYLNPTSEHDVVYGAGHQIFEYEQTALFRYGGEIHGQYAFYKHWQTGLSADWVVSTQLSGKKQGFTIPFSPPPSGQVFLKWTLDRWLSMQDIYFKLDYQYVMRQNRIVPPETETPAYQLWHFSTGTNGRIAKMNWALTFQIKNILNTKYYNHMSYYRMINMPEPARTFTVNLSIEIN